MDCNMVSPLLWDLENLIMSNPSKTENNKKQLPPEWEFGKGEGIESIVPDFLGFERVSSGSATTSFWHTAVSKSSQSTSINSSSLEVKPYKVASETSPGNSCSNIDFIQVKASTALEVSVASPESDLCLKLGKRTYSEELWGKNNNDISAVSINLLTPSVVARKKSKSCGQSMLVPRCQIDGCELDLSSAKDYHRKHRVCEKHSKCPRVIVSGLERRFCQQCSRFHAVTEFDEKKRSCRKRLSHHNARRRKPQGVFSMNPERAYADRRQHTNMLWDGLSLNTRSEEQYEWGTTYDTKPTQIESGFTLSFQRGNGSGKQFANNSRSFSTCQTSGGFSVGKSKFQLHAEGVGEYLGNLHESQDFHRALSLLSTSSDPLAQPHVQPFSTLFAYDVVPK